MTKNNKDYIINLRVSRVTYDKIKKKALENQESISNLVRKSIEDTAEIMADLSDDLFGKKDERKDILSHHKTIVAKDIRCDGCGKMISTGSSATIGETAGIKKYFFCKNCKQ